MKQTKHLLEELYSCYGSFCLSCQDGEYNHMISYLPTSSECWIQIASSSELYSFCDEPNKMFSVAYFASLIRQMHYTYARAEGFTPLPTEFPQLYLGTSSHPSPKFLLETGNRGDPVIAKDEGFDTIGKIIANDYFEACVPLTLRNKYLNLLIEEDFEYESKLFTSVAEVGYIDNFEPFELEFTCEPKNFEIKAPKSELKNVQTRDTEREFLRQELLTGREFLRQELLREIPQMIASGDEEFLDKLYDLVLYNKKRL